ncbi:MAG TPA: ABC transporter ATP-binding protein [Alphaproteobacteria bacterium]
MIAIRNLTKDFGPIRAVDNVSFSVARGEVLGFLGPNGAGKSTTMKMITGYLTPTSGTAVVCGHDVLEKPVAVKRCIGYLPEGAPAYPDMTPAAFLDFIAAIRGLHGAEKTKRIGLAVDRVQLKDVLHQPIETLSKGFKRRVGLAQAMLHDPEVLILDEPTDGLDPNQKHEVRTLIRDMARDKAIIISTHILEEVDAVCTRAVIIARGRIVADGTPAELEARSRWHNAVSIVLSAPKVASCRAALQRISSIGSIEEIQGEDNLACLVAFPINGQPIITQVSEIARNAEFGIEEVRVERGRLDEVFRNITTARA